MNFKSLELPYLFNDRFELIELLGVGGMGSVFMAQDKILKKEIAIKILDSESFDLQLVRFQQEAKAIAKLQHPNILEVYDFASSTEGHYFLAIELIKGESLHDYLEKHGTLSIENALDIGVKLLRGLEHAHNNDVLHRDIKPSNVMLAVGEDEIYQVKLVDFGLAKVSLEDQELTATGVVMGSPLYMSPEQGAGIEVDERSDIYSFGCLIFRALTGRVPFQGEDVLSTISMRQFEQAPKLSTVKDDLEFSPDLENILAKCLATKPGDRFQSVGDAIASLAREQERLKGSSVSEEDRLSDRFNEKSKSQLAIFFMVILVTAIIAITILAPLIGRYGEKVIEDSEPEVNLKEVSYAAPFGSIDSVITSEQLVIDQKRQADNGKTGYLRTLKYDSDKLSIDAYKKAVEISKHSPVGVVVLNGCDIDDKAMNYITQIRGVEELRLTENEGISPDSFKLLKRLVFLKRLYVNRMKLTDQHIEALAGVTSLTGLDVARNLDLTSTIFDSIKLLPNLESLVVGSPNISIEDLVGFANSKPNLYHLGIRVFPKGDLGAENLALLKHVSRLDLSQSQFSNSKKAIDYIAKSKCINYLELNYTGIKGKDVLALNSNPNMKNLSMDHCRLNDEDVLELAKLKYISQLSLKNNLNITIEAVKEIAKCKNVTVLYVRKNEQIKHEFYSRKMLDKLLTDSK